MLGRLSEIGARLGLVIVVIAKSNYLGIELYDVEKRRSIGRNLGSFKDGELADTVADDRHHVAILDHVQLIAEPSMPGHDHRAGFS